MIKFSQETQMTTGGRRYPVLSVCLLTIFLCLGLVLTGCEKEDNDEQKLSGTAVTEQGPSGNERPNDQQSNEDTKNVTLDFWGYHIPNDRFMKEIAEPVNKKFPHLKLEPIRPQSGHNSQHPLIDFVQDGKGPDIILGVSAYYIGIYEKEGVLANLEPWIKKYNMELSEFNSYYIAQVRDQGNGQIFAFPYIRDLQGMFYNQELFDELEMTYPHDGMSWDETIELARKLHVNEPPKPIIGLAMLGSLQRQLSLTMLDSTGKSTILTDPRWSTHYQTMQSISEFYDPFTSFVPDFIQNKKIAIGIGSIEMFGGLFKGNEAPFRWDVVSLPVFPEVQAAPSMEMTYFLAVNPKSEQQELSFQVIQYLTSKTFQTENSQRGNPSVLADMDVHRSFAQENPILANKNLAGLFHNQSSGEYKSEHPLELELRVETSALNMAISRGEKAVEEGLQELDQVIVNWLANQSK